MTARGTDWTLAALVLALTATGVLGLFGGDAGDAWIFAAHGIAGAALALLVAVKLRRVWRRLTDSGHWDRRTAAAAAVTGLVAPALASGFVWAAGGDIGVAGYNLLSVHMALGVTLALLVLLHALARAKPIRGRDLAHRRQFVQLAALGGGAVVIWSLQRPLAALLGWRGADRRFTGSYEKESFTGNDFPTVSWFADDPRPLDDGSYRLEIAGLVERPLALAAAELDAGDELVATLDCTGGFYSTQRWRGSSLERLVERAAATPGAAYVRVISHTGYRWSFPLAEAPRLLLATHVGDEPLSHGHGAPLRLVAPGRRGVQWVKWVARIELSDEADTGALASTIWSSFTAEGRGAA